MKWSTKECIYYLVSLGIEILILELAGKLFGFEVKKDLKTALLILPFVLITVYCERFFIKKNHINIVENPDKNREDTSLDKELKEAEKLYKKEDKSEAIEKYKSILMKISNINNPTLYAYTTYKLGLAYCLLSEKSNKESNILKGISSLEEASSLYTFDSNPEYFGDIQLYSGSVYAGLSEIK